MLETLWRKLLFMLVKKKSYLPAQTEVKFIKNTKINYWLITGWTLCVLVYVISCVLIISHGLKIGQVKSSHWLMSIIISLIQDALFVEPLLIIISSCVLYKFNQQQNIITGYQIKLANYRKNTRNQLRNVRLVRSIRESRNKYVYNPFSQADVEVLRNKQNNQTWIKHFRNHSTTCLLTFLISFCCIGALYSFDSPMHIIYANNINKLFLKNIVQSNTMDLEMLKTFLTTSLTGPLQMQEYYNGIPIANISKANFNENNRRGWYNLYNSKLINGGIRLLQNRITTVNTLKIDVGNYKEGWKEISKMNNITAWMYRSIPVIKYFGLWFPEAHNSGFMLDLTGELSEYRKKLNTHLENGWLDNRTRNLVVEFQTYTPNIDCITVFKIQFQTTSGLLFTVNNVVYSIPSNSIFVSWITYAFTLGFMIAFAITAMRLTRSVLFMVYNYDVSRFWTTYECVMLAIVLCTTFTVAGRWRLMEQAGEQYAAFKETEFVTNVTDMCRAHEHITALVVLVGIMALFRVFRLATYRKRVPYVERTLHSASGPVAAIAAYALIVTFGMWYCAPRIANSVHGFFNVFVLGRNAFNHGIPWWSRHVTIATTVTVFLLFNAAVVSIITKYYIISKTISG
ncbi:Polycystin cation channel, PKD1/PKD2 [Cinara cedri]|uniref:Polycystin cation channel, PKD1/PKD2 n=1 Tax=Cinara cedri TaxID=506608 RepID=A0A5E4NGM5_9HEMI|nr:Polycystin cation channel, PKD1/PKD2 [Cinara cedri]